MNDKFFITLQHLLPQHALSRLVGGIANCNRKTISKPFITWFAKRYQVNMGEAACSDLSQYACFNDFFTRALKPGARVVDDRDGAIVSPADGKVSQLGEIRAGSLLQAKGRQFSLVSLLGGDTELAEAFQEGSFCTVYLSPKDYHRVHMPLAGTLTRMIHVPGKLFSVNQLTSEHVDSLFARNERVVCIFDTETGPMALVLVGAMIVASVDTVWAGEVCPGQMSCADVHYEDHAPAIAIGKGEEMGRFKLGSTVIALFGPGMVQLDALLKAGDAVSMGQSIGTVLLDTAAIEDVIPADLA